MGLMLGLLLGGFVASAVADDGTCVTPLEREQRWVGQQLMLSLVVELRSPGLIYVCADLPDNVASSVPVLRRKGGDAPDPVIDACVSLLPMGAHPGDGFARVQLRDTAGSYMCVGGPDAEGVWGMLPARTQQYRLTWYVTP